MEAQGRGLSHGHSKYTSAPRWRAARLKTLFAQPAAATEHGNDELATFCERARHELMRAASALQYDSVVLPGRQLSVSLLPEPFSAQQQRRSRLDGLPEEMDDDGRARQCLPISEAEPNGHVKAELCSSVAEQRMPRDAYKELPLTGAMQSMMPSYRLPTSFSRIRAPDEYGHSSHEDGGKHGVGGGLCDIGGAYVLGSRGEVVGARLPSGSPASEEDLAADAAAWAASFARDQRSCFVQHHSHECTATCVKHLKGQQAPARPGQKLSGAGVPKCRLWFYRCVSLTIESVTKCVMIRGKELVPRMFIATGNDQRELGKAIPVRTMPFYVFVL